MQQFRYITSIIVNIPDPVYPTIARPAPELSEERAEEPRCASIATKPDPFAIEQMPKPDDLDLNLRNQISETVKTAVLKQPASASPSTGQPPALPATFQQFSQTSVVQHYGPSPMQASGSAMFVQQFGYSAIEQHSGPPPMMQPNLHFPPTPPMAQIPSFADPRTMPSQMAPPPPYAPHPWAPPMGYHPTFAGLPMTPPSDHPPMMQPFGLDPMMGQFAPVPPPFADARQPLPLPGQNGGAPPMPHHVYGPPNLQISGPPMGHFNPNQVPLQNGPGASMPRFGPASAMSPVPPHPVMLPSLPSRATAQTGPAPMPQSYGGTGRFAPRADQKPSLTTDSYRKSDFQGSLKARSATRG